VALGIERSQDCTQKIAVILNFFAHWLSPWRQQKHDGWRCKHRPGRSGSKHPRWSNPCPMGSICRASPHAQLTFFAEYLETTGVYDSWVNNCPLYYRSANASGKRDVLGTWLLAILAGHKRYAHSTTALSSDCKINANCRIIHEGFSFVSSKAERF